jgi:dienelactone hydrolase
MRYVLGVLVAIAVASNVAASLGQTQPASAKGLPGDEMMKEYLAAEALRLDSGFLQGIKTADDWQKLRGRLREEYLYMLGLSPMPERTPLKTTVTGTLTGDGFVVEKLHFQSRPGLYVTGNLYRPATPERSDPLAGARAGKEVEKHPAVLYLCGHANHGRDGCKAPYQSSGIWFARHGYVCLMIDTLQLGEIAGIHHGTYRESRWWWHSRGYTPAGVECWNGIRGIEYLVSRPDVDPERIAVTGISGGGAATLWVAAADDRVKVAVPVSGMSDLQCYVAGEAINGHCDCMFLYNTFAWPWTNIAALVAPRPMLFINSDADRLFPMDGNERIINRLEQLYSLFGAGDRVDSLVSIGGHDYRQDIRQGVYRFINTYLKNDPRPVTDSEVGLVGDRANDSTYPIAPEKLRVWPSDADIPTDQLNTKIDELFVPMASPPVPSAGEFETWRKGLLAELRRVSFRALPEHVPAAERVSNRDGTAELTSERGIHFTLSQVRGDAPAKRLVIIVDMEATGSPAEAADALSGAATANDAVYVCRPRGVGETRWTHQNPPNYVERSLALLGRTADAGRVCDVIAAARYLAAQKPGTKVHLAGKAAAGVIAAYAALLEPEIAGVTLVDPPASHMATGAPQFLNVLRVCDIPDAVGMLAPRPVRLIGAKNKAFDKSAQIYKAARAAEQFSRE